MRFLFATRNAAGLLVLRLFLAVVIFPHGAQKVFGWFGGAGYKATVQNFTEKMDIPMPLAVAAIVTEFVGPILLVFGFLTRISAAALGILISVAAWMVHWQHGFFMNWQKNQSGEGFEYHLLVLGMALALVIEGAGALSVDRALAGRGEKK